MLSFTGLLSPLILAASLLMGAAILDSRTVYVQEFDVPQVMAQAGYGSGVFERKVLDQLRQIERQARTRPETRRLTLDSEKSTMDLLASYMGVEPLVRAVQSSSSLLEYSVTGDIVEVGGEHFALSMRIKHHGGQLTEVHIARKRDDIDGMVKDAAQGLIRVVDPQVLCAALVRNALATTPLDLTGAEKCLVDTIPYSSYDDRTWLWNLAGIIQFMKGDRAGSAKAIVEALKIDPDFTPGLLNIGILYALEGRHNDAIKAFQMVFRRTTSNDSPQTFAATYTEWGLSLLALGRRGEATQKFSEAIKADPKYAAAYENWANLLPPGPQKDALTARAAQVARNADQLYTENILGLIRNTALLGK